MLVTPNFHEFPEFPWKMSSSWKRSQRFYFQFDYFLTIILILKRSYIALQLATHVVFVIGFCKKRINFKLILQINIFLRIWKEATVHVSYKNSLKNVFLQIIYESQKITRGSLIASLSCNQMFNLYSETCQKQTSYIVDTF